ncbi:hypothetical protein I4I73_28390 [Pseudonocardia sp. KRD-184]|uniref:Uncharacterized protein n=2 Tax=Pseudonocardia oceani TaxID=2792013 RepID=A0ABS6U3Z9_9PSEU|nr:hypothetical protein [Pseudonocardia oceani]MBW0099907.1 hypothetical protein [Pseudonocardia oceani]MBW0119841.1 hypothetical protein [Pseudonocardia oceani]MBW0126644.1 hypothetical protein [Pseudonocardia oceani]
MAVDVVVTLGREARLDVPPGTDLRHWNTDEPSERGIDGVEQTRLVCDHIDGPRVRDLLQELPPAT